MNKAVSIRDGRFINKGSLNKTKSAKIKSAKIIWHPLEHQVWRDIQAQIPPTKKTGFSKVLLGVSGGVDSMALLEVFRTLQQALRLDIYVCHVHHGTCEVLDETLFFRQKSLDCVEDYCRHYQLPFILKKNNGEKLNSEADFRTFRYKVFAESLVESGADFLCLAHHIEDLFETRLLRLIRGTGLLGLESMGFLSHREFELSNEKTVEFRVFRPFIETSKNDLIQYCVDKKVAFIQDPSNLESDFMRNFLRNEWLPQLEMKQKGSLKAFARSLKLISEGFKEDLSSCYLITDNGLVSVEIRKMQILRPEEKKRVVVLMLHRLKIRNFSAGQVNEIIKRLDSSQKVHTFMVGSVVWSVDAKQISIRRVEI
jgi:tRNA(Ile)-lysidine synthase